VAATDPDLQITAAHFDHADNQPTDGAAQHPAQQASTHVCGNAQPVETENARVSASSERTDASVTARSGEVTPTGSAQSAARIDEGQSVPAALQNAVQQGTTWSRTGHLAIDDDTREAAELMRRTGMAQSPDDPALARIAAKWPGLPEQVRRDILAMLEPRGE
jgi:hypothetical protein